MFLLIVIYVAFISLGLPDSIIGAIWPIMHQDLHAKLEYAGLLSSFVSVGTIISTFYLGKLKSKFKSSTITFVSIMLTATGLAIFSFASSFFMIILGSIPLGLGGGAIDATLNAYVASNYKAKHLSFLHAFWGIGTLIGPIMFGFLLTRNMNWRTGYLILATVQTLIMFMVIISRPHWVDAKENLKLKTKAPGFFKVMKQKGVIPAVLTFILYVGFENSFMMWAGSYLVYGKNFSPEIASFTASLFFIGLTFSRIVTGFMTSKFSDKTIIISGITLLLITCSAMLFSNGTATAILLFLVGFGCGPIYPLMMHESATGFLKEYTPSIIGYQSAFSYVGIITVPALYGFMAKSFGQWLLPLYTLIFVILELYIYLLKQKAIKQNNAKVI